MSSSSTEPVLQDVPIGTLVAGRWEEGGGPSLDVFNPSHGSVLARVHSTAEPELDAAVTAARGAFTGWASATPRFRADCLLALADRLDADIEHLAQIESLNAGHPISSVRGEITSAADRLRFYAGCSRTLEGRSAGEYTEGYTSMIRREPIGVTALIAPWNYPLLAAVTKLAPAIAAGNTAVLKPSEQTPLSMLRFADLTREILPPGVLNLVTGRGEDVGAALVRHPGVDMVSLTGGTATGKAVSRLAADSLKRVHLELGGKAPVIVLDGADPATVASSLRAASFWNAGQDCSAASRVIATPQVYEPLLEALTTQAASLSVGDAAEPSVEMGPLTFSAHRDAVRGYLERTSADGAEVHTVSRSEGTDGFFLTPTIVTGVQQRSEIVQQEVFGPVVTLQRANDREEALRLANDVQYGLGASVFTNDITDAMSLARRLEFGTVWVNDHGAVSAEMPWGGYKQSGHGRERSVYAIEEYTQLKHVMIKSP